jgi:2-haloacid dehalogenase
MNFSRFQLLTFDCYGTLVDWESGILAALRPLLDRHGAQLSDAEILHLYAEFESAAERPPYRRYRDVLAEVARGFAARLGFTVTDAEAQSLPESLGSWLPFPDTVASLRRLKARYRLGIISNVDDDLFGATARRLEVPFDVVVTAQQAQSYKPSLRNFELMQQRAGIDRMAWLHVAQSLYHDHVPARQLGLASVWVNRPRRATPHGAAPPAEAQPSLTVPDLQTLAERALS